MPDAATRKALSQLLRYEIRGEGPIGSGGCGVVWAATDTLYDRPVALKTISERLLWTATAKAERTFRKEAIAGARLGQLTRHVVAVNDIGRINDILYFTMEWIEPWRGRSIDIASMINNSTLREARIVMLHACEALRTAHQHGIIHSDVAPWNIVYDPSEGVYKLADFGLLRIIEDVLVSHGSGSMLSGGRALFFPAPVRIDSRKIGKASDVYALAATYVALLAGLETLPATPPSPKQTLTFTVTKEQREASPPAVRLANRFIRDWTEHDTVEEFEAMLVRIPV